MVFYLISNDQNCNIFGICLSSHCKYVCVQDRRVIDLKTVLMVIRTVTSLPRCFCSYMGETVIMICISKYGNIAAYTIYTRFLTDISKLLSAMV